MTYGVFCQVRLNQRYYDETSFLDAGIAHEEVYFLDGTVPPPHVLYKFIAVCEATSGAVAVHCKVGCKCDAPFMQIAVALPCRSARQIVCLLSILNVTVPIIGFVWAQVGLTQMYVRIAAKKSQR